MFINIYSKATSDEINVYVLHLYQFGPVNVNAPNAVVQWFVCNQMRSPNVMGCVHCDHDATEHRDSVAIARHAANEIEKILLTD